MMKVRHSEKLGVELMCRILCVQDPPAIAGRAVYTKLVCKIQLLCPCLLVDCNTLAPPPTSHCGGWQECPDSEQEHHLMYNWSVVTVVTVASRAVFLLFICSPSPSPPHSRLGHGAHSFQLKMSSSSLCVLS